MKKISSVLFSLACITVLSMTILTQAHASLLEDITFKKISDTEEQIVFQINADEVPSFFAIKGDNPRIVFDFPNTTISKNLKNKIETEGKYVKRIRVGLHKGAEQKVRVVFDLTPNETIDIKKIFNKEQKSLTVTIQPLSALPEQSQATTPIVKEKPATQALSQQPATEETITELMQTEDSPPASSSTPILSSIKFDKSSNRGEMVLFKLNDFFPPVVFGIEEELPRVVCDFMDTTVTNSVPSVLECDGQFVKTVRTGAHQNPNKVRVVLDLAPHNNYDLQQVFFKEDNLFVLIINKIENVRNPEENTEEKKE